MLATNIKLEKRQTVILCRRRFLARYDCLILVSKKYDKLHNLQVYKKAGEKMNLYLYLERKNFKLQNGQLTMNNALCQFFKEIPSICRTSYNSYIKITNILAPYVFAFCIE